MMMDSIPPFTDGSSSSSSFSSSSSSFVVSPLVRTSSSTILSARRCWNKIDAASSGYVSSNDMYQYLQRFIAQHQPTPPQTQSRVNNSNRNGEEKEESPQPSTAFASLSSSSSSAPSHSSSSSSPSSLSAAAASLCQRARAISQKDLDELIAFADCNGDNKLDLDEMLQAYQSFTSPSVSLMARFESQILEKGLSGALPPPASRHALNGNSTVAHRSTSNNSTISSTPILPIASESNGPIGLAPPADSTNTGPVPKLADIFLASSIKLPSVSPASSSSSSSSSHPTHPASSANLPSTSAPLSTSIALASASLPSSSSSSAVAAAAALSPSASGNVASMVDVDGQSSGQDYDPIEMIEINDSEPFE